MQIKANLPDRDVKLGPTDKVDSKLRVYNQSGKGFVFCVVGIFIIIDWRKLVIRDERRG